MCESVVCIPTCLLHSVVCVLHIHTIFENVCLCSLCKHLHRPTHTHIEAKRETNTSVCMSMYRIFYPLFWGALLAFPLHQCTMPSARTHVSHLQWDKYKAIPFFPSLCIHKNFGFQLRLFLDPFLCVCLSNFIGLNVRVTNT